MIGTHAARRAARLSLAAGAAATRFVTARRSDARVWRPLALRWRRARPRRAERIVVRAAAATNTTVWAPRYHVHLAFATRAPQQSAAPSAGGARVPIQNWWRPLIVHRFHTLARAGAAGPDAPHARRASGPLATTKPSPAHRRGPTADQTRAPAPPAIGAPRVLSRPLRVRSAVAAPARERSRLLGAALPNGTAAATRRQPRAPELRLRAARSALAAPSAEQERGRPAAPHRTVRAADIVWRRAPVSAPAPGGVEISQVPLTAARPTPTRAPAAPDASAGVQARAARGAPIRAGDIEPAVLDRLTEDVIRRVERRARIDRERRGL